MEVKGKEESLREIGKFIFYANIPYLYPHSTNRGESGVLRGEAYVSDIWPLKNLGEFLALL